MKLREHQFHLCSLFLAALTVVFGGLLTCHFFAIPDQVFADDGTPIRTLSSDHFVTIHDQSGAIMIKTSELTVAEILNEVGITVAETDRVEPSLDTIITSDYHINIYRSHPVILVDGVHREYVMASSHDPKQIALDAGFTIYDGDTFSRELNANFLEAGAVTTYRINRGGGSTITLEETLSYTTEIRYDYDLKKGDSYTERVGEDGRKISVYHVEFEDGAEVSRELISEEVIREPVAEVIVMGAMLDIPVAWQDCAAWAREAGVAESDLEAALDLMHRESGCRVDATNPSSGAYGIPQALPGIKMASFGEDWESNPVTQIRWMSDYVTTRYGGWQEALDFWWCTGVCSNAYGPVVKNTYWY